ncbi:MAG: glutamine-hydrolyzing carbamoyl-phosphate synthase small subunit [Bacteroidota bacterium]|nr:glutamine-hydrolyzing carbamoyl-phosphate synthase small subunit [Bacteroidota bacterium]MDX5429556.1 glutamine-hydrolyzing carbamoyl-phosphate synthase small subunit [Bacteroidota bacterium]MDX5468343.1 glutamine-hydrolyzing carbamoyl-phosphate synthase small subunit [Bacteroidota bacterium]
MAQIAKLPSILVLEDGTVFHGTSIGKIGTTTGEICFNTGLTGYQEIFTDPSYFGQILVATVDHIGNYGISDEDIESDSIKIAGLVCKNFAHFYSRSKAKYSIHEYFTEQNLVGIADVDTRQLVRYIRQKGAMNAIISSEELDVEVLKKRVKEIPSMHGLELASKVSTSEAYELGLENPGKKVAVLDLGLKQNILRCLLDRGLKLKVFPAKTSYAEMAAWNPDGFMLTNGPGDPASMPYAVDTVKEILSNNHPVFGICMGNQILGRACGLDTFKMFNGHRGLNHPVKNLQTGRCEITSQNHGFAIENKGLEEAGVEVTHIHLNDNTIAGIRVKGKNAFSVQYHPESNPGPHDSRYLFDDFVKSLN